MKEIKAYVRVMLSDDVVDALGVCPSNHRTTLKWGFIV